MFLHFIVDGLEKNDCKYLDLFSWKELNYRFKLLFKKNWQFLKNRNPAKNRAKLTLSCRKLHTIQCLEKWQRFQIAKLHTTLKYINITTSFLLNWKLVKMFFYKASGISLIIVVAGDWCRTVFLTQPRTVIHLYTMNVQLSLHVCLNRSR